MIRVARLAAVVVAINTAAVGADYYTVNVPLEFEGIHSSVSHVSVTCRLSAPDYSDSTGTSRGFGVSKTVVVPLQQYTGSESVPKGTTPPPVTLTGGWYKGTVPIVFTDIDFAGHDPKTVQQALCYYALRTGTGSLIAPQNVTPGCCAYDTMDAGGFVTLPQYSNYWQPMYAPYRPTLQPDPGTTFLYRWHTLMNIPKQ